MTEYGDVFSDLTPKHLILRRYQIYLEQWLIPGLGRGIFKMDPRASGQTRKGKSYERLLNLLPKMKEPT